MPKPTALDYSSQDFNNCPFKAFTIHTINLRNLLFKINARIFVLIDTRITRNINRKGVSHG